MSQSPLTVPSGSGLDVRRGFNDAIAALATLNSGPVPPESPQGGLMWYDTTSGVLKIRNLANTEWSSLLDLLGGAALDRVIRHDAAQALSTTERARARDNIAALGKASQTLSTSEKSTVRGNIAALSYEAQTLTEAQKIQARANIGASSPAGGATDIGAYVFATGVSASLGQNVAGSSLRPIGAVFEAQLGGGSGGMWYGASGDPLPGTWQCAGHNKGSTTVGGLATFAYATLYRRVA